MYNNNTKIFGMHNIKYLVPTGISFLRLLSAPLFYHAFLNRPPAVALAVFVCAALTDIADGFFARVLCAESRFGAYADAVIDFVFVVTAFSAFFKAGLYCLCIIVPPAVSFTVFLITSASKRPVYDPFGKYMGAVLMAVVALTVLLPSAPARIVGTVIVIGVFAVNMVTRFLYLKKRKQAAQ